MEITREEIDRIIKSGTPMERIRLYYTNDAETRFYKKGFLTDEERGVLVGLSYKTTADRNLWDKYIVIDNRVGQSLMYLSQLSFAHLEQVSRSIGYEMIWVDIEENTILLNSLLAEIEDRELRDRLVNKIVKKGYLLHKYTKAEDYIDYKIDRADMRVDLTSLIKDSKRSMEYLSKITKPYIKAFREFMIKKKFSLPPYKEALRKIEEVFTRDIDLYSEFSRTRYTKQEIEKFHYPKGVGIDPDIFVYPKYKDIPLDEDLYKHYKEEIFK